MSKSFDCSVCKCIVTKIKSLKIAYMNSRYQFPMKLLPVFCLPAGGVAAYNFGVDDVRTWERLDVGTTNGDYSNDVIARAQYLKKNYGWS